jgi:tetratricopeptide (TPR) repeat protein
MKLLEGIQLHELILIILGFILGLALIFIFLYTALRSKPNLKLLYGFVAPLVMIGYPSIQSVQFSKDVIKIDKLVENVNKNPTDTMAQNALRTHLETLPASRCKTSSDAMTVIANAQAALGSYDAAKENIEKAKIINPNNPNVTSSEKEINERWSKHREIENRVKIIGDYIKLLEEKPNNSSIMDSLSKHTEDLIKQSQENPIHLDNRQIVTVAKANAIIGDKESAVEITTEVLRNSPKDKDAVKLNEAIKNKEIDKKFKQQIERQKVRNKERQKDRFEDDEVKPSESKMASPQSVPSPAPVFQDTAPLRLRLIPRSVKPLKIWDKEQ